MAEAIKCADCGRFIAHAEMDEQRALCRFEPDSHFGPEVVEWRCEKCLNRELDRLSRD